MFDIKSIRIPKRPGCYLYKDGRGKIIYVGKAKNLKNRVRSYFTGSLDQKTQLLVSKIRDVEFITTNNEVEALLLEQSLIHKHQPKFNIDLKGSIRYAYIKVTDEKFPRIVTSRKIDDKGRYYGPYTDGTMRRQVITTLVKLFKIRTCTKLPKKVCLQYHIGNCLGPCEDLQSQEDYMINIRNAERLLKGETSDMVRDLESRMHEASENQQYELARIYRDQIQAVSHIQDKQAVDQARSNDQDVINWIIQDGKAYIQVFNVLKGVITSRHKFSFDYHDSIIEEFVNHYYSIHYIPEEIILPQKVKEEIDEEELVTIESYLREKKQEKFAYRYLPKVTLKIPRRGVKKELVQLVLQNLEVGVGLEPGLLELKKKLRLRRVPQVIEFFDISNLKNKFIVGASVQLVNGEYNKNKYRKFKIKSKDTQDDFASMKEVVFRRYRRILEEGGELPDLICIDGGRGQLNAATTALAELELHNIDVCSIAKREEEIYMPGRPAPLRLNKNIPGMKILIKGRDEVHRFVLAYNRKLRKKALGS